MTKTSFRTGYAFVPLTRYFCPVLALVFSAGLANAQNTLSPISPSGRTSDRTPTYSWQCDSEGEYEVEVRKEAAGVEFVSDARNVMPADGVCTLKPAQLDQLRLAYGTLPINRGFEWRVRKIGDYEWSEPAYFTLTSVSSADFSDFESDWLSFGGGWQTGLGELSNNSITEENPEFFMWTQRPSGQREQLDLSQFRDIAVTMRIDCRDSVVCKGGIALSARHKKGCREKDEHECANGGPPQNWTRILVSNDGKLTVDSRTTGAGYLVLYEEAHEELDALDTMTLRVLQAGPSIRVQVNGEDLVCQLIEYGRGLEPNLGFDWSYGGIAWHSSGGDLGGEGLVVHEAHIMEGPKIKHCFVPIPDPLDEWRAR